MASRRVRITKSFVEQELAPGIYVDEKTPGFRLKVTSAGRKIYIVYGKPKGYRTADGKANAITYTIGHHGQPAITLGPDNQPRHDGSWTADKAEREAQRIWGLMRAGINPNDENQKRADADQAERIKKEGEKKAKELTLRLAFEDYLQSKRHKGRKLKDSTVYVYRCDIEKCLADWLDKPLLSIEESDVEARHRSISKDHPGQANHVMRILRAVFNFAMDEYKQDKKPIIEANPVRPLSKKSRWNRLSERSNIIMEYHLEAFFKACDELGHPIASDYLPFLLLTGLRADEAASLQWSQVDFKQRLVHIRETKNGNEHRFPLTDYLYALLKSRWQHRASQFVFGSEAGYMSDFRCQVGKVVERARQIIAASDDEEIRVSADSFSFTPHDLRRTFGTTASMLLPAYMVKRLLNHVNANDVTLTHYIHADTEMLREPMQAVNKRILDCAGVTDYGAPSDRPVSKVVQLREKRSATR